MQGYSYSISDLDAYESEAIQVDLDAQEVLDYGSRVARQVLTTMPHLKHKGLCVVMYDTDGIPISILPIDPIQ